MFQIWLKLVLQSTWSQYKFQLFKNVECRARHSEFVICYQKYMKSIRKPICIGEKIQMQYEMDDSSGKRSWRFDYISCSNSYFYLIIEIFISFMLSCRCSGVVIGACDLDPNRWPNSKWRCLLVRFIFCAKYRYEMFLEVHCIPLFV